MSGLLWPLVHWHWWILGVALAVAELFAPGIFLIWLGIAAGVTGFAVLAWPMAWEGQLLLFGVLSVASAVAGRTVYSRTVTAKDHPLLNRRGAQMVGQAFFLETAIEGGSGRVRVGDSTWKVIGPDAPAGARVRVVGVEGTVLKVEPETGS